MLMSRHGPQAVGSVSRCWTSDTPKPLFLNLSPHSPLPCIFWMSPCSNTPHSNERGIISVLQKLDDNLIISVRCFGPQRHLKHTGLGALRARMERPWPKPMESHQLFYSLFTYSLKSQTENAKRLMPNRKMKFKSLNGKWKR